MFEKTLFKIRSHWSWVLVFIGFVGLVVSVLIFYPGYMSADTLRYLRQATGVKEITDLQPPALPILWKSLIFISDKISSVLFWQLLTLWTALVGFAYHVYKNTDRKILSLLPLIIGILPFVINISGVIWADNHLAFSLLLSIVVLLYMPFSNSKLNMFAFLFVLGLILYATLVRNNSFLAAIPLIPIAVWRADIFKAKYRLFATAFLAVLFIIFIPLSKFLADAKHISSTSGPMMDDIVHIMSAEEIKGRNLSDSLEASLLKIHACTEERKIIVDSFPCATEEDKSNVLLYYGDEVESTWKWALQNKGGNYVLRKITVFVYVLFPPEGRGYIWHEGISPNEFGLTPKFEQLGEINRMYVFNFGYKHFSYLYEPWFWLFANIAALAYSLKITRHRRFVQTLSISSLLYFASFIPTGIAADYRYIYWPVLAALCSGILILTEKYQVPESVITSKSTTRVKKNKPNNNK